MGAILKEQDKTLTETLENKNGKDRLKICFYRSTDGYTFRIQLVAGTLIKTLFSDSASKTIQSAKEKAREKIWTLPATKSQKEHIRALCPDTTLFQLTLF